MKSLCAHAFMSLLLVGVLGAFLPPAEVFAQEIGGVVSGGTTTGVQPSKNELSQKANILFSNFITQLEVKQRNPKQLPQLSNASDATISTYVQGNKDLIQIITTGKEVFTQLFSNPATTSTNVYADFTAALNAASSKINQGQESTASIRSNAILRTEVTIISKQINTLAQERQQELINSGQQNQAVAIQNAVGVQRGAQAGQEVNPEGKCTSLWDASIVDCLDAGVNWIIKNIFLEFAGVFLWLTANMLNYAIQIGILNFSTWAPDTLYPIWVIVRQIVSLLIIFIGLYLGFMYILGKEEKFEKYIPWVIIFALFVNFSYPLARTTVDISNIVSLKIYSSATGDALTSTLGSPNTAGSLIMDRLGLNGLVLATTKTNAVSSSAGILKDLTSTPASLLAVAFVLYAAYIFFMVTALIVVRTVSLVFLTIASPILFVDSVLPILGDRAQYIRKIFFEQLAVGPVFMIMFALTLRFLEVFSSGPMKNVGTGGDATIKTFFNILMMLIMLHIMLKVTKSVAGEIGTYGTNFMGKVGGFGLGVASGGAGLLARTGIGGLADRIGKSKWVTNNQDSFLGRSARSMSNSLANSTFDLRNSSVVGGHMNKIGMGMGMGTKVGYAKERDARVEKKAALGANIGIYQENEYYDDGSIKHKKGDEYFSPEVEKARRRFAANGGSILGSVFKNETHEVMDKVADANKARFQTKQDKAVSEYGKFDKDEEGQKQKKEFFDKQDTETQAKLMKYDSKLEAEKKEKDEEKAEKKNFQSATLQTNKDIAEGTKALAEALESQKSKSLQFTSNNTSASNVTGGGTSSSDTLLSQNTTIPTRSTDTPHTTANQQATTQQSVEAVRIEKQQSAASRAQQEMGDVSPINITTKRWVPPKRSPPTEPPASVATSNTPTSPQKPGEGAQNNIPESPTS